MKKSKVYSTLCLPVILLLCNFQSCKTASSHSYLAALNLAGPVKEVIYESLYSVDHLDDETAPSGFTFDSSGRLINQEIIEDNIIYLKSFPGSFSIGISNGKINSFGVFIFRTGEWELNPTKFNSAGLAIEFENRVTESIFAADYSDFDDYGNWTTMSLKCIKGTRDDGILKIPDTITRRISYYKSDDPSLTVFELPSEDAIKLLLTKAIYYDTSVMGEQLAYYVPRYLDCPGTYVWDGGLSDSSRGRIIYQPGTQDRYADCLVGDISLHQANKLADKYYVSFSYKILLTDDEVKNSGDSEIIAEKYRGLALIKCEDGAWLIEDIGNGEYDAAGYIFCRDMFEDRQDWEIGSLLENASLQVNQFEEALRNGSLVESIKSYFANRDSIVAQENINGCLEEIYPYQEKYMSHKSK